MSAIKQDHRKVLIGKVNYREYKRSDERFAANGVDRVFRKRIAFRDEKELRLLARQELNDLDLEVSETKDIDMELEADSGFNLKVDPEALIERIILPPDINNRQLTHVGGTSILARNGRGRCGERPHARNGRSRATRRSRERSERDAGELAHRKAAAASGAGRDVHTCPAGCDTRRSSYRPGGLRKGEAASVVPRPREHRRDEERSGGRGMPSGRGLSGVVAGAGYSASLLGGRLLFETAEQLCDVRTVLPAPMRANRRDQRPSLFGAQMSVPSVVDDEPRRRDDPRAL